MSTTHAHPSNPLPPVPLPPIPTKSPPNPLDPATTPPDPAAQEEHQQRRRRAWNRSALLDLFPRIPSAALESVLDLCAAKGVVHDLSLPRGATARRFTSVVVAHVRHRYSNYERLLREGDPEDAGEGEDGGDGVGIGLERYEARRRSAPQVWRVLREWCPWDSANEVLERCFRATLVPPAERDVAVWDPMEVDDDSDVEETLVLPDDPMDLD